MNTRWSVLVILLSWSGAAAAQDKPFVWKEGKCALQFPGEPRQDTKSNTLTFVQLDADGKLAVIYLASFKADPMLAKIPAKERKAFLEKARDLLVQSPAGKLLGSKDVKTGGQEGLEFQYAAADKGVTRICFYLTEGGLYHLQVTASQQVVNGKEAEAYFKSFKFVK